MKKDSASTRLGPVDDRLPLLEVALGAGARQVEQGHAGGGGLLTWRSACLLQGLSAAAPYYGGGVTTPEESARSPKVPVLAHFAEEDTWIPMDTVQAFAKAHREVEVHTYAAHHGFNCDQRGSWHAPSAQLARERTLAFFAKHVG